MISVDDIVKLTLAFAVSFAIVVVSWQFKRVLEKLADAINDTRNIIQDIAKISSIAVGDYEKLHQIVDMVYGFTKSLQELLAAPAQIISFFSNWANKSSTSNDEEKA